MNASLRGNDLYSLLLDHRNVFITSDITKEYASHIAAQLMYLDAVNNEPITLLINCNGGDIDGLNTIVDTMHIMKSDVVTVNIGAAYSCGALILINGTKRYAYPNSKVLLHQPLAGLNGYLPASDLEIRTKEILKTKQRIKQMILDNSSMTLEEVDSVLSQDTYFTAQECLEYGIIDEIL